MEGLDREPGDPVNRFTWTLRCYQLVRLDGDRCSDVQSVQGGEAEARGLTQSVVKKLRAWNGPPGSSVKEGFVEGGLDLTPVEESLRQHLKPYESTRRESSVRIVQDLHRPLSNLTCAPGGGDQDSGIDEGQLQRSALALAPSLGELTCHSVPIQQLDIASRQDLLAKFPKALAEWSPWVVLRFCGYKSLHHQLLPPSPHEGILHRQGRYQNLTPPGLSPGRGSRDVF